MDAQVESTKSDESLSVDSDNSQVPTLDPADGNFISRKFLFAAGTSVLIFVGGILAGVWKVFDTHYESMIQGLLMCLGAYLGSNVSSRFVTGKHLAAIATANANASNQNRQ